MYDETAMNHACGSENQSTFGQIFQPHYPLLIWDLARVLPVNKEVHHVVTFSSSVI